MKIPKIVHQCWFGDNRPEKWLKTFQKIYKDWDYRLWTEDNLPKLYNQEIFNEEERPNTKGNILRYELLYKYGGVYFDADMICLKKIPDSFLDNEFFSAIESEEIKPDLVNNGVIGCYQGHPVMEMLVKGLKDRDKNEQSWKYCGPLYLTEVLNKYDGKKVIYKSKYFHPKHFKTKYDSERFKVAYTDHKWGTTKGKYEDQDYTLVFKPNYE